MTSTVFNNSLLINDEVVVSIFLTEIEEEKKKQSNDLRENIMIDPLTNSNHTL